MKNKEIKNLLKNLEEGINELMQSSNYKNYLDFVSSFYNYSYHNLLLIYQQMPHSTMIGSYTFWKSNGRQVKKGERSIRIIAPIITKKQEKTKNESKKEINPKHQESKIEQITEETTSVISGYRFVPVFDISQTTGKEIPKIINQLSGHLPVSDIIIETITSMAANKLTIEFKDININGFFSPKTNTIVINKNLSENQKAKTLIHEYAHSQYHFAKKDYNMNRAKYEIEAESTAYIVSKHFNLDTSDYSFGYITGWGNHSTSEIKKHLENVTSMASSIIACMEDNINKLYENYEKKEKIIFELKRYNFSPETKLVKNIYDLNKLMRKNNTLKDIHKYKTSSTLSADEQKLVSCIVSDLQKQEKTRHMQLEL